MDMIYLLTKNWVVGTVEQIKQWSKVINVILTAHIAISCLLNRKLPFENNNNEIVIRYEIAHYIT